MTFEKVKEIIMDTIKCSEDKITLEANLKDDLGIDSLDSMELMMAVEDAYGITVPEEELPNLTSVKAIVEYVDKNAA
jgi:acyl carrier protein